MPPPQTEHLIRTVAVLLAWLGVGAAYLVLLVVGDGPPGSSERLEGMLAVLTPAALDTMRVAKREKVQRESLDPPS